MFHVGQRVVCLRSGWKPQVCWLCAPEVGEEYIIRTIDDYSGRPGLRFHWLINPPFDFRDGFIEPAFVATNLDGSLNFRPVVERKTDISIFTALLNPVPSKVTERVR